MIGLAVQALVGNLQAMPGSPVPPARIGAEAPANPASLPAIRVRPERFDLKPAGIGGLVHSRPLSPTQWEEKTARRAEGRMAVEIFAASSAALLPIVEAVLARLEDSDGALRGAGYLRLGPVEWQPEARVPFGSAQNGPAYSLQALSCQAVFESVAEETPGPDGIIQRIDVDLKPPVEESMEIN